MNVINYIEIYIHKYLFTTKICSLSTLLFLIPVRIAFYLNKPLLATKLLIITIFSFNHWHDFKDGCIRQKMDRIIASLSYIYVSYESITVKPILIPYILLPTFIFLFSLVMLYNLKCNYTHYIHVIFHFTITNLMVVYVMND